MTTLKVLLTYILAIALLLSPALFTSRVLLPGDHLWQFAPWAFVAPPGEVSHNVMLTDVLEQFYPYYCFLRSEISEGRFPLWNPFVLNGTPFLATSVSAALSPLNWLLLVIPTDASWEWGAFLKLLLAGTGIFAFLRKIGVSSVPAAFAGAVYLFAGYNLYFLLFPNTFAAALFGWGLAALEDYLQTSRRSRLSLFALIVAVSYLSGHVESAFLQHLAYGLYTLVRRWKSLPAVIALSLVGCVLAMPVIFPFLEFLRHSGTLAVRSTWGESFFVPLDYWPALFIPYYAGSPFKWTGSFRPVMGYSIVYLGIVPLFFASFAYFYRKFRNEVTAILVIFAWSVVILFAIPPFLKLFASLPLLKHGNHFHIMQIFHVTASILSGFGLAAVRESFVTRRLQYLILAGFSAALLLASFFQIRLLWHPDNVRFFFVYRGFDWPWYVLWVGFTWILIGGFMGRRRLAEIALLVVLLNGLLVGTFLNSTTDAKASVGLVPPEVQFLKRYPHDRVVGLGVGTLVPNYGMRWELRDFRGYESVFLDRIVPFYAHLTRGVFDWHQFIVELNQPGLQVLKRAGCSFILSSFPLALEGIERLPDFSSHFYKVPGAERALLATRVTPVSSPEAALSHVQKHPDSFNVAIEGISQKRELPPVNGKITWKQDLPDLVELKVETEGDSWLVLRDTYYTGWRAVIDGAEAPIRRADFLFRAVEMPAGSHVVRFEYRPLSFRYGLAAALMGVAILLGFTFVSRRSTAG